MARTAGRKPDAGTLADKQVLHALHNAPAPLALSLGEEHKYVYANAAMEEATGHHLTGRTVRDAFPELPEFHALRTECTLRESLTVPTTSWQSSHVTE